MDAIIIIMLFFVFAVKKNVPQGGEGRGQRLYRLDFPSGVIPGCQPQRGTWLCTGCVAIAEPS